MKYLLRDTLCSHLHRIVGDTDNSPQTFPVETSLQLGHHRLDNSRVHWGITSRDLRAIVSAALGVTVFKLYERCNLSPPCCKQSEHSGPPPV